MMTTQPMMRIKVFTRPNSSSSVFVHDGKQKNSYHDEGRTFNEAEEQRHQQQDEEKAVVEKVSTVLRKEPKRWKNNSNSNIQQQQQQDEENIVVEKVSAVLKEHRRRNSTSINDNDIPFNSSKSFMTTDYGLILLHKNLHNPKEYDKSTTTLTKTSSSTSSASASTSAEMTATATTYKYRDSASYITKKLRWIEMGIEALWCCNSNSNSHDFSSSVATDSCTTTVVAEENNQEEEKDHPNNSDDKSWFTNISSLTDTSSLDDDGVGEEVAMTSTDNSTDDDDASIDEEVVVVTSVTSQNRKHDRTKLTDNSSRDDGIDEDVVRTSEIRNHGITKKLLLLLWKKTKKRRNTMLTKIGLILARNINKVEKEEKEKDENNVVQRHVPMVEALNESDTSFRKLVQTIDERIKTQKQQQLNHIQYCRPNRTTIGY